jgi:hypothetical protein
MKESTKKSEAWDLRSQESHPSEVTDQRSFENSPQVESLSAIERRLRWSMIVICFDDDLVFPCPRFNEPSEAIEGRGLI